MPGANPPRDLRTALAPAIMIRPLVTESWMALLAITLKQALNKPPSQGNAAPLIDVMSVLLVMITITSYAAFASKDRNLQFGKADPKSR